MLGRSLLMKSSGSLLLYPGYVQHYLDQVTATDVQNGNSQGLERGVTDALSTALQDLVADTSLGISGGIIAQAASKIKAMPFMCAARTLNGCLVPVVGPAPTNIGFLAADYNRKTGIGDPLNTSKYLDTNRNNTADPQDSKHIAVYATNKGFVSDSNAGYIGIAGSHTSIFASGSSQTLVFAGINGGTAFDPINITPGLIAANRSASNSLQCRGGGTTFSSTTASTAPVSGSIALFRFPNFSNARISHYSIGESLDLAVLDARISTLMATLAAVLP